MVERERNCVAFTQGKMDTDTLSPAPEFSNQILIGSRSLSGRGDSVGRLVKRLKMRDNFM